MRQLPVNKLVRVCSFELSPPMVHASVLITADGYVRRYNLGGELRVRLPQQAPIGPARVRENLNCLSDLTAGKECEACHVDVAGNAGRVTEIAEQAQDFSLTHIGEEG